MTARRETGKDRLEVLEVLASHPATARFIAFKLGRMFVQDRR